MVLFVKGLPTHIKQFVLLQDPEHITEALRLAKTKESVGENAETNNSYKHLLQTLIDKVDRIDKPKKAQLPITSPNTSVLHQAPSKFDISNKLNAFDKQLTAITQQIAQLTPSPPSPTPIIQLPPPPPSLVIVAVKLGHMARECRSANAYLNPSRNFQTAHPKISPFPTIITIGIRIVQTHSDSPFLLPYLLITIIHTPLVFPNNFNTTPPCPLMNARPPRFGTGANATYANNNYPNISTAGMQVQSPLNITHPSPEYHPTLPRSHHRNACPPILPEYSYSLPLTWTNTFRFPPPPNIADDGHRSDPDSVKAVASPIVSDIPEPVTHPSMSPPFLPSGPPVDITPSSMLMTAHIGNSLLSILVDTGSSINALNISVFNTLPDPPDLQAPLYHAVTTVDGSDSHIYGHFDSSLTIGHESFPLTFHIINCGKYDAIIDEVLDLDIIQESYSPWAAPIVLVTKKDGFTRFCCDFRKLNAVTVKDSYPLPRIDDTLDSLSGSSYFSTLEMRSGFWQIEVEEESRPLTASFHFLRGPL